MQESFVCASVYLGEMSTTEENAIEKHCFVTQAVVLDTQFPIGWMNLRQPSSKYINCHEVRSGYSKDTNKRVKLLL